MIFLTSFFPFPVFGHCMSKSLFYFAVPVLCCVNRQKLGVYGDSEGTETSVDGLGKRRTSPDSAWQAIHEAHQSKCFMLHPSSYICEIIKTMAHNASVNLGMI